MIYDFFKFSLKWIIPYGLIMFILFGFYDNSSNFDKFLGVCGIISLFIGKIFENIPLLKVKIDSYAYKLYEYIAAMLIRVGIFNAGMIVIIFIFKYIGISPSVDSKLLLFSFVYSLILIVISWILQIIRNQYDIKGLPQIAFWIPILILYTVSIFIKS